MRIQVSKTLTVSVLQEFQQQYPRFRCSMEMKGRRMQIRPGGTSGKCLPERHHKPPHASEPEQKPQISLQLTEKLLVAEIRQESLRVQMHRKTTASELRKNADSSLQHTHSKCIARFSAAIPEVQMLSGNETPQSANLPCRCLRKGSHRTALQNTQNYGLHWCFCTCGLTEQRCKTPHASEPE